MSVRWPKINRLYWVVVVVGYSAFLGRFSSGDAFPLYHRRGAYTLIKGTRSMKPVLCIAAALLLSACDVNTSGNIDFDANDLSYFKDVRTGLCFAAVASRKTMSAEASGFGLAEVRCTPKVLSLIR